MPLFNKKNKKALRKFGRNVYKATGLTNPIKKGKISTARLIKDVALIKSKLNAEKKQVSTNNVSQVVAQCFGTGYGHWISDVTPALSQNVTGTGRIGNSIRVSSMVFRGQLIQQSGASQAQKIKIEFFLNKGTPISGSTVIQSIYDLNFLNGLYDINSQRALDTFKNWQLLASRTFTINQDNQSSVTGFKDITIPLSFKNRMWKVKYDDNNTTTVQNGQVYMVVTAYSGNGSSSTASTNTFIPVTAVSTGSVLNYYINYWVIDN